MLTNRPENSRLENLSSSVAPPTDNAFSQVLQQTFGNAADETEGVQAIARPDARTMLCAADDFDLMGNRIERPAPADLDLRTIGDSLVRNGQIDEAAVRRYLEGYSWWERNVETYEGRAADLQQWLNRNYIIRPPIRISVHRGGLTDNSLNGNPQPHRFEIRYGNRPGTMYHLRDH